MIAALYFGIVLNQSHPYGAVFVYGPHHHITYLHTFTGGSDGAYPSTLLQMQNNSIIGTTTSGGAKHMGTIFQIFLTSPKPKFVTVLSYCDNWNCQQGNAPNGPLQWDEQTQTLTGTAIGQKYSVLWSLQGLDPHGDQKWEVLKWIK